MSLLLGRLIFLLLLFCVTLPAAAQTEAQRRALLPKDCDGTSSLFFLDGRLWTCNDHGALRLYALDTVTGHVDSVVDLGVRVYDLEEVTQDDSYLFFGDFGDNKGVRDDLRILRLAKGDLRRGRYRFDTIAFNYPDRGKENRRDFDCEAFVASGDSLYLFTKQWLSQGTVCYSLPKRPGRHTAHRRFSVTSRGLVTAACLLPQPHDPTACDLILLGYTLTVRPFVLFISGFSSATAPHATSHPAKTVTARRCQLANAMGTQTEALATLDGHHFFLTNEALSIAFVSRRAALLTLDLDP